MIKKHKVMNRLLSVILIFLMVFNSMKFPTTVQAMGTNASTLDPTSWIGSGEATTSIKMLSGTVDVPTGVNISVKLLNNGKFQVNAPNLVSGFRYIQILEDEEYAEPQSQYKIFSRKANVINSGINNGASYDCSGGDQLQEEISSGNNKKYLTILLIEDSDINERYDITKGMTDNLERNEGMTYGWGDFEIPYGVLFNVGTGHGTAPNAISYDSGGNVTLPNVDSDYQYLFDGWYTSATGGTKIGNAEQTVNWSNAKLTGYKNTTLYAHWKTHNHSWKYVADGNKIYAYCDNATVQCPYYGSGKTANSPYVELTTPSDKTYDGTALGTASVSASSNWSITGQSVPTVSYSPTLNKNAGTYTASIKVGSATASKAVKINQREVNITAPTVASLTYNENEQNLLATNGTINNAIASDGMKLEYRLVKVNDDSTETQISDWSEEVPQAKNVGNYKVYYKIKNADGFSTNYKIGDTDKDGSKFVLVSIEKETAIASTVPSAKDLTYDGTEQALISAGSSTTGTIKYRLGTTGDWSATLPSGKAAKDYDVYYKVFGDDNHNDSTEIKIENTKIKKKVITSLDWTNDSFTYDKDSHKPTATVNASDVCAGDSLAVTVEGEQKNASATPYTATATGLTGTGSENYELTTTEGVIKHNFTINPVVVTIDWSNTTLTYNGESQTPTVTVKGVLDGEACTATVTGGKVDANTSANPSYTATVAADALSSSNYKLNADATTAFTVNPRPVALTWSTTDLTYTGAEQSVTATVSNKVGSDDFTLTYENTDKKVNKATEVGTYTAVVTGLGNDNYTLTGATGVSQEWKISYLDAKAIVSGTKKIEDSGWYTSEVTVTPETAGYLISEDKTTWSNSIVRNTDGTHTVEYYIKDTNGFITDKKTATFKIDTTVPTGTITIKDNNFTEFLNGITFGHFFKDTVDVAIEGKDSQASTVDAVSGIGKIEYQKVAKEADYNADGTWTTGSNFSVKANKKFIVYARITDKAGNVTIINSEGQVVYTDATASDSVEYIKTSTDDKATNIAIGVNTIKAITYKDVTTSAGAGTEIKNVPADGYELVDGKIVLKNQFLKDLQAGNYEITVLYHPYGEIFGSGEDADPSIISLTVKKADGTVKITNDISKTYDKTAVNAPTFTKGSTKDAVVEYKVQGTEDSTYTATAPIEAGKYTVRVSVDADENYTKATDEKDFTISKEKAKITVTEANKSYVKTYGDDAFTLEGITKTGESDITFTSNDTDVVAVDKTGKVTIKGAGKTTITLAMAESDNYESAETTISVTVNPKAITVSAGDAEKTYGEADPKFTYTPEGLVGSDTLENITFARSSGEDVGEYDILVSQKKGSNKNYSISFESGTFTIKAKEVTVSDADITITGDGTFVYDGTEKKPAVVVKDGDKVIPASEYTVSYQNNVDASKDTKEAADKPVVIITDNEGGNYTVNGSKTFEIAKADPELSVNAVADKTYGDAAFTLEVTKKGESEPTFASSDDKVLTVDEAGKVTLTGAGTATVTVAMAESKNYNEKSVQISIKVVKKNASLVVDKLVYEVTYGDADFTIDGITKEGESAVKFTNTDDSVAIVDATGKVTIKKVGETTITLSMDESENYEAVTTTVTVKVVPKKVTVTADDKTKVYKEDDKDLTYTAEGLVGTDKLTGIKLTRGEGEDAGSYAITVTKTDGENSNYDITLVNGKYEITPKSIIGAEVTLGDKLIANGTEQTQEVASVVIDGLKATYTVTGNKATDEGTYKMTITGNGNFKDSVEKTFVIVDPENPADQGNVKVDVVVDPKAPETEMTTPKKDLMEMLMTADEAAAVADGATLDIWLEVNDATDTITETSKKQISNGTSGYKIGQYIDISLFKKLSTDAEKTQITGTNKAVQIEVTIPNNLINKNNNISRTYAIVRNHEGKVEILKTSYDSKNHTLTFETDQFSDYAIIYKDTDNSSDDDDDNKPTPAPTDPTKPTDSTKPEDKKITSPKTGDDFDLTRYLMLMMAGLLGMVGCVVYKKKEEKE